MRLSNWKLPVGEMCLADMLDVARDHMVSGGFEDGISYYYHASTFDGIPSYELVILYGEMEIFASVYIIDTRFSTEIKKEERYRIEDLLAAYAVSTLTACGLIHCISYADSGSMLTYVLNESDDKDFLNLQ